MTRHFQREIDQIKKKVLTLSAVVEESLHVAVKAIETRNLELVEKVAGMDKEIDSMEVELEEDCLKIFALHQPVAIDLRFLVAVLKLNNDLERIGDLALSIARRTKLLAKVESGGVGLLDLSGMAEKVKLMLHKCLQSLVNMDVRLAWDVCGSDDEIDQLNRDMSGRIVKYVQAQPEYAETFMQLFAVSRSLERIADHCTNIAEDVIYLIEGEIVRHGKGPG